LLPRSRYSLFAVERGNAGLERMQQQRPDVVLLDINMPGMDGYEFLARMQDDPALTRVPAIVLTSAILQPHQRTRLQRAAMVMSKSSLSSATLVDAIQGVLSPGEQMLPA
jgi:CheY-like chemotaxis protein